MLTDEAYKAILTRSWDEAPSYPIPARTDVEVDRTPLYASFYHAHAGRGTGTVSGQNSKLRKIGETLDCALPISRKDTQTRKFCQNLGIAEFSPRDGKGL